MVGGNRFAFDAFSLKLSLRCINVHFALFGMRGSAAAVCLDSALSVHISFLVLLRKGPCLLDFDVGSVRQCL